MKIAISNIKVVGEDVVIEFEDGHRAVFMPYRHGFGYQVEGLMHFTLFNRDDKVFEWHGRLYRAGPAAGEHRIAFVSDDYTQESVAAYWRVAKTHIHDEYFKKPFDADTEHPEELWYPWKVVCTEGGFDLQKLEGGDAEFLVA